MVDGDGTAALMVCPAVAATAAAVAACDGCRLPSEIQIQNPLCSVLCVLRLVLVSETSHALLRIAHAEHTQSTYSLDATSHGSTCTRQNIFSPSKIHDGSVDVFCDLQLGGGDKNGTATAMMQLQEGERIELRLVVPSYGCWTCECRPEGHATLSVQVLVRA